MREHETMPQLDRDIPKILRKHGTRKDLPFLDSCFNDSWSAKKENSLKFGENKGLSKLIHCICRRTWDGQEDSSYYVRPEVSKKHTRHSS